jgi:adenosylmethionine-8-amino-7-oxononanoate aminotransferase
MCLSKGLTGGFLPLGATLASEDIYRAFYSDDRAKMLFHGHSYTANPLACSAAIASLELMERPETWDRIGAIEAQHRQFLEELRTHALVSEAHVFGTLLRFELRGQESTNYLHSLRDFLYREFLERGVLLRPLGNVVYILPPYCVTDTELAQVFDSIRETLEKLGQREKLHALR